VALHVLRSDGSEGLFDQLTRKCSLGESICIAPLVTQQVHVGAFEYAPVRRPRSIQGVGLSLMVAAGFGVGDPAKLASARFPRERPLRLHQDEPRPVPDCENGNRDPHDRVMRPQVVCSQESDDNRYRNQDGQVGAVALSPLATLDELLLGDLKGNRDVASDTAWSVHLAHATESDVRCRLSTPPSECPDHRPAVRGCR
jgi:hypothetical protein